MDDEHGIRPMQLWYAPTSPFARKVRMAAIELDLSHHIELVEVDPWTDDRLRQINPLSKVPILVLDDGTVLYESGVICDYLDSLGDRRRLFPQAGKERWRALLMQGLADGASTAAGRLFADERRAPEERSQAMMGRFRQTIDASLDTLDADETLAASEAADTSFSPTIGHVSAAVFLGYLDFRWPRHDWREGRAHLAAWFGTFAERPCMTATRHRLPT